MPIDRPARGWVKAGLLALCLCASVAQAQVPRLGSLFVLSERTRPFEALVEVEDPAGVLAPGAPALAPPGTYEALGLPYPAVLSDAVVLLEKRAGDGRTSVIIRSTRPAENPEMVVVLALTTPTGRQVRSYRLNLDTVPVGGPGVARLDPVRAPLSAPASGPVPGPAPVATPAPLPAVAPTPSPIPAVSAPPAPRVEPIASGEAASPAAAYAPAATVRVEPGDTIASLTARILPAGATEAQAAMALYRNNAQAFAGSIHRPRQGAVLTVPTIYQMLAVPAPIAEAAYRAETVPATAAEAPPSSAPSSAPPAAPPAASMALSPPRPRPVGDRLDLETQSPRRGRPSSAAAQASRDVAFDTALAEARTRIQQLEKIVADMQALIAVKERQMAALDEALNRTRQQAASPAPEAAAQPPAASAPAAGAPTAPIPGASASMLPEPTRKRLGAEAPEPQAEGPGLTVSALIGMGAALIALLGMLLYSRRRQKAAAFPDTEADPTR